jgi:hypothetical protein
MKRILKIQALAAVMLICLCAPAANAQIGTGWTSYSPGFKVQLEGCGANSGLVFKLTCSSSGSTQKDRAERRYDNITASQSQFQGTVTVNSLTGDRINLKQTFQDSAGPWNMIAVKKPGTLYEVEGGNTLASYTIGTAVRINTITNTSTHTTQVYINGSLKETKTGGQNPLYDKFGTYRTSSGLGPVTATWSSIHFWKK